MEIAGKDAILFPVKNAVRTIPYSRLGRDKGAQGDTYFTAPNPPDGVVFTYYVKEAPKSRKQIRLETDAEAERKKETPPYPTAEQLRLEAQEDAAAFVLTITDAAGLVVRRLAQPAVSGLRRTAWDLRGPAFLPPGPAPTPGEEDRPQRGGFAVIPGTYRVSLAQRVNDVVTGLAGPVQFTVAAEGDEKLKPADRRAIEIMRLKVARLQTAFQGATEILNTLSARAVAIKHAVEDAPKATSKLRARAAAIETRLQDIDVSLRGNPHAGEATLPEPPSVFERVQRGSGAMLGSSSSPTRTVQEAYADAASEFTIALAKLRVIAKEEMPALEKALDAAGVPHTPGRFPEWREE